MIHAKLLLIKKKSIPNLYRIYLSLSLNEIFELKNEKKVNFFFVITACARIRRLVTGRRIFATILLDIDPIKSVF